MLCGCHPYGESGSAAFPISFASSGTVKSFEPVLGADVFSVLAFSDASPVPSVLIDGESYPFSAEKYWPRHQDSSVRLDFIGVAPCNMEMERSYSGNTVRSSLSLSPDKDGDVICFHTSWVSECSPVHVVFQHVYNRVRRMSFESDDPQEACVSVESVVVKDYADKGLLVMESARENGNDGYAVVGRSERVLAQGTLSSGLSVERLFIPGSYTFELSYSVEKYGRRKSYCKEIVLELGSAAGAPFGGVAYDIRFVLGDDIVRANTVVLDYGEGWQFASAVREDFDNPYKLWILSAGRDASSYADSIVQCMKMNMLMCGFSPQDDAWEDDLAAALDSEDYPLCLPCPFVSEAQALEFASSVDSMLSGPPMNINAEFVYDVRLESDYIR